MKIKTIIICFMAAFAFASCSTELKLAKRFVGDFQDIHAAVYFPEQAKVTLIQSEQGDYSKVLDSLDQNAFLDIMYAAYADEMKFYGVDVYIPEDQDNVPVDSLNWLVVLSQVEIQGLITNYTEEYFDLTDEYGVNLSLNTVNVAAWFDINDGEWLPTLYYEHNLRDDVTSSVRENEKGVASCQSDVKPICIADVYNYAVYLGKQYAGFTYNTMMNRFIRSEMLKSKAAPRFKLTWDPSEKAFYLQEEEDGFIEL